MPFGVDQSNDNYYYYYHVPSYLTLPITRTSTEGNTIKSWLAPCVPSLGCGGNSRCALVSTGALQVANQFVRMIALGSPSGDLQLVTLVALIALDDLWCCPPY